MLEHHFTILSFNSLCYVIFVCGTSHNTHHKRYHRKILVFPI